MVIWNIYYGHVKNLKSIWEFSGNLVYFTRFGLLNKEESGNPDADHLDREIFFLFASSWHLKYE
jgi:hypothetical protein